MTAARQVADHAAGVLMAEAEPLPTGTNWSFVPQRFCTDTATQMPNLSHGLAGIATALALAGAELDHPDLTSAARSGAEHLVALGDASGRGFVVPRYLPNEGFDEDEVTYSWCHGATGTSLLFLALEQAGVEDIAGEAPLSWHRRCLHSVRNSGLPARLHPPLGQRRALLRHGRRWRRVPRLLATVSQRGRLRIRDAPGRYLDRARLCRRHRAYWPFVEHRAPEPLLPPGVGWMHGAAGIAAFLFRVSRIVQEGPKASAVPRMDTWWALPNPGALRS